MTQVPQGKAVIQIQTGKNGSAELLLKFKNNRVNTIFTGVLKGRVINGTLVAEGVLNPGKDNIDLGIQGELGKGKLLGALYARKNKQIERRIELGYGNPIQCNRIQ